MFFSEISKKWITRVIVTRISTFKAINQRDTICYLKNIFKYIFQSSMDTVVKNEQEIIRKSVLNSIKPQYLPCTDINCQFLVSKTLEKHNIRQRHKNSISI